MTLFLCLIIWTLVGVVYYTFKVLGSWGRTRADFNIVEKAVLAPAYVITKLVRAFK